MHINSVCTNTCTHTQRIHVHTGTPCPPHLCVNELFLWRGQVERSRSFQPKKSIASSWIIEMFAISFFTKKKKESLFNVSSPSILFAFTLWYHDMKIQIPTYKSFYSFNHMYIAVFEYPFFLQCWPVCAHTHFSRRATVILLPALS